MSKAEVHDNSFKSWLFSRHELVEKTAGLVVLSVEIVALLEEVYPAEKRVITQILNLFFLIFIAYYLKGDFAKRFSVDATDPAVIRILRFSRYSHKRERINELIFNSNTLIAQLKNINYFILFTAGLYVVLIAQYVTAKVSGSEKDWYHVFHFVVDLLSYAGAFCLLRCFYVMYLTTVDKTGNDILKEKTNIYIIVGFFVMVFDVVITLTSHNGVFISEFFCGVVNAIIFILLIARFENKILDIPPWVLCLLYLYAILQTCLPFVTGNFLTKGFEHAALIEQRLKSLEHVANLPAEVNDLIEVLKQGVESNGELKKFLEEFNGWVLTLCLVGKVTLSAVLLYVLNSKRIFYYFMTIRKIHAEEEVHWNEISPLIENFSTGAEPFSIVYARNDDSLFGPNSFQDAVNFVRKLVAKEDPISAHIHGHLSNETQDLLAKFPDGEQVTDKLLNSLAAGLNNLLKTLPLYEPERFQGVRLTGETKKLIAQRPSGKRLMRLNRVLLEQAYPQEITEHLVTYTATIPGLFNYVSGEGRNVGEAKKELLKKIENAKAGSVKSRRPRRRKSFAS
jgi:hypothetical protein